MSPLINDGDIVAVDGSQTNPDELNRKIVVAWHRQKGLSLARFIAADGVHLLESENRGLQSCDSGKRQKVANCWKGPVVDPKGTVSSFLIFFNFGD